MLNAFKILKETQFSNLAMFTPDGTHRINKNHNKHVRMSFYGGRGLEMGVENEEKMECLNQESKRYTFY